MSQGAEPPRDLQGVVTNAVAVVTQGVKDVVKPGAAAAVANTFSFPLALMVIVVLFLLVQPKVDRGDPRLRARSAASDEGEIGFEEEDQL